MFFFNNGAKVINMKFKYSSAAKWIRGDFKVKSLVVSSNGNPHKCGWNISESENEEQPVKQGKKFEIVWMNVKFWKKGK